MSEAERVDVDRLAFCLNLTRSGELATIVARFLDASGEPEKAKGAEKDLRAYLAHCRKEGKMRSAPAADSIPNPTEKRP